MLDEEGEPMGSRTVSKAVEEAGMFHELNDEIAALVAANDATQTFIDHLEETSKHIEDNCRSQKQIMCEKIDSLIAILEERKQQMMQKITSEQEEKMTHCKSLIKSYAERIQSMSKLVETALQSLEEPQMAVFLQNAKILTAKLSEATRASVIEDLEHNYENMNHYNVDVEKEQNLLQTINFHKVEEQTEEGVEDEEGAAEKNEDTEIVAGHLEMPRTEPSDIITKVFTMEKSNDESEDSVAKIHFTTEPTTETLGTPDIFSSNQDPNIAGSVDKVQQEEKADPESSGEIFEVHEVEEPSAECSGPLFEGQEEEGSITETPVVVVEVAEKGESNAESAGSGFDVSEESKPVSECPGAVAEIPEEGGSSSQSPGDVAEVPEEEGSSSQSPGDVAEVPEEGGSSSQSPGAVAEVPEEGGSSSQSPGDVAEVPEEGWSSSQSPGAVAEVPEEGWSSSQSPGAVAEVPEEGGSSSQSPGAVAEVPEEEGSSSQSPGDVAEVPEEGGSSSQSPGAVAEVPEEGGSSSQSPGAMAEVPEEGGSSSQSSGAVTRVPEEEGSSSECSGAEAKVPEEEEETIPESSDAVIKVHKEEEFSSESPDTVAEVSNVKETSCEFPGAIAKVQEGKESSPECPSGVAEVPKEKETSSESPGTVDDVSKKKEPNSDSLDVTDEVPEEKESTSECSGAEAMIPEEEEKTIPEASDAVGEVSKDEELSSESSGAVGKVSEGKYTISESSGAVAEVPEEKMTISETPGAVADVHKENEEPRPVSSAAADGISKEKELNPESSDATADVSEESNAYTITMAEISEKETNFESSGVVADVYTKSSDAAGDVPPEEVLNNASHFVKDEGLSTEDLVNVIPETKESNETFLDVPNAASNMEENHMLTADTEESAKKILTSTTLLLPDKVSVIEESIVEPPGSTIAISTKQELNDPLSDTVNAMDSITASPIVIHSVCPIGESEVASSCMVDGIPPGVEPIIPLIDVEACKLGQEKTEVEEFEAIVQQDAILSGSFNADDLKMTQLLEVVDEEIKLYPGGQKCDSWHVINSSGLAPNAAQHVTCQDQIEPTSTTKKELESEHNPVGTAEGSPGVMKKSDSENKVSSPVMQALGFCLSMLTLMVILHNLWNRIEYMTCTKKG
ncbi:neurofilament medium polypeptide-like [Hemiscyllium ocellatum]|uniref:neurofilament medium polypeptide-like n=1 Tax=Hemiscyllium ocellatum TaxID=170820 RepID=UPI002966A46F|nr:neurofilament medium polypeptide-like [Hemiscyllium ocellatum]